MQELHNEGIASYIGPESCGGGRKTAVEALTGEVWTGYRASKTLWIGAPTASCRTEGKTSGIVTARSTTAPRGLRPQLCTDTPCGAAQGGLLGAISFFTEAGRSLVRPRCESGSAS
jgi:hypothetical protein